MIIFISSKKLFSFLRYLIFCPDFFGHVRHWGVATKNSLGDQMKVGTFSSK